MQNLLAPTSESGILLDQYESSNTVNSNLNFIIPLYENMPKGNFRKTRKRINKGEITMSSINLVMYIFQIY